MTASGGAQLAEPARSWPPELIGSSPPARRLREQVQDALADGRYALVVAEPGFDAGVVARAAHEAGVPARAPFVIVDCAAPTAVGEALFGRSVRSRHARHEGVERLGSGAALAEASGGTLFLRNVTEMPTSVQARLSRVTRDGEVVLDGGGEPVPLDVRLVAGCGPDIDGLVEDGGFRGDLFRRLGAARLEIPALRLRLEDVPELARHLLDETAAARGVAAPRFTRAALGLLSALPWDGNLRELGDVVARLADSVTSGTVRAEDVLAHVRLEWRPMPARYGSLREARRQFERDYIAAVLRQHGWRMGDAARALGIARTNLYRKARQLNIPRVKVSR